MLANPLSNAPMCVANWLWLVTTARVAKNDEDSSARFLLVDPAVARNAVFSLCMTSP